MGDPHLLAADPKNYNRRPHTHKLFSCAQPHPHTMKHLIPIFALTIAFGLALAGCDLLNAGDDDTGEPTLETVFEQTFDDGTSGWLTDETSGPEGWCGDITHVSAGTGSVSPSAGSGYAVAEHGACNDYYVDNGFPSSGPYGPFGEYSDEWPSGGFAGALDIYLDPNWSAGPDGSVFTYAISIRLLDGEYPANLRYFFVPVTKQNGNLLVAGHEVTDAGWYTFRHVFSSDENGNLAVDFELVRDDQVLFTQAISSTSQSGEETSSFTASNVGNGYAWFVAIRPGLRLPIDEQKLLQRD